MTIDWTLNGRNSDEIPNPKDLSNGWYQPERRIGVGAPSLTHAIQYIKAGLGKFGFKVEERIRQPYGEAEGNYPPCVIVFATVSLSGSTLFAERDAIQTAWVSEGGAKGPWYTLASILTEWGVPIKAEQMPPFYPHGTVSAQVLDPVGKLKEDGSNVHYEVSEHFDPIKWPANERYTRILPNGDYAVFVRTSFAKPAAFLTTSEVRPGWRRER